MNKKTVIFDLDGTLAIIEKRRLKAGSPSGKTPTPGKMDWDVFFDPDNIKLDEPNHPVIKMAQLFNTMVLILLSLVVGTIGLFILLRNG